MRIEIRHPTSFRDVNERPVSRHLFGTLVVCLSAGVLPLKNPLIIVKRYIIV